MKKRDKTFGDICHDLGMDAVWAIREAVEKTKAPENGEYSQALLRFEACKSVISTLEIYRDAYEKDAERAKNK